MSRVHWFHCLCVLCVFLSHFFLSLSLSLSLFMFSFVVRVCVQNRLFGPCVHAELQRCRAYASSQGSDSCLVAKGERERERQSFLSLSLSPEALQAVTVRAEGLNVTLKSLILTDVNQLCRQRERGSSLLLSLVSALGNIARCALRRT